jgi:hypothetical protein
MKRPTTKCLVVAAVGILPALVTYAQAAPPTQPVNVVNTPLPVKVLSDPTAGGSTVSVNGNVNVTNSATNPVPVKVLSDPTSGGTVNINGNVTVTNPATNPVHTADAYPRIPVATRAPYTVPDGYRFVVETATGIVLCAPGSTRASLVWTGLGVNLVIPMQFTTPNSNGGLYEYDGIVSARVVFPPGTVVSPEFASCDTAEVGSGIFLFGYLVSVSSPSLAP